MPPEHFSDARGATTPDAVQELLRFVREAQAALDQPPNGGADPALAHTSRTVLQSLIERAQEQLAEVEAFRHYVDAMADPVIRLDGDLRIVYLNGAAERALGLDVTTYRGLHVAQVPLPSPAASELRAQCERVLEDGAEHSCLLSHPVSPDGEDHHLEYRLAPEVDANGRPRSVLISAHDVSERLQQEERHRQKSAELEQDVQERLSELAWTNLALQAEISQRRRAERELQSSEHRLAMVSRTAGVGIWHWSPSDNALTMDDTARHLVGLPSAAPVILESILEIVHPEDREELAEASQFQELEEGFQEVAFRVARPEGGWRWLLVRGQDVGEAAPENGAGPEGPIGRRRAGIVMDVTAQREADLALHESERRLREVLDSSVDLIFRIDLCAHRFDYMSPSVERIMGYSPEEVARFDLAHLSTLVHPDDLDTWLHEVDASAGEGAEGAAHVELRWRRRDGEFCWLAARYSVVADQAGEPVALVGVARDVTERKVAQIAAEQRLVELMALYEASQTLLSEFDPQRVLQRVADLAVERFGLHMAWAGLLPLDIGQEGAPPVVGALMHAGADDEFAAIVRSALRGERTEAFQDLVHEGVPLVHQNLEEPRGVVPEAVAAAAMERGCRSLALLPMPSGEHPGDLRTAGVLAVYATERHAFDDRQIQALGSLANLASLGIQRARLYHEVAEHARSLEADIAESAAELLNSEARFQAMFQNAALGIVMADLDGRFLEMNDAFCALLGGTPAELRGRSFAEFMALEEGVQELVEQLRDSEDDERRVAHVEQRYRRVDERIRWGSVTVSIVRDAEGRSAFAIGMLQDITEEKEAHAALIQAQRLNVTGQMAAALTHEVKNPLQSVIGCLGLIDEQLGRGSSARLYLQVARQELHRADRILNRLRDLNRKVQAEESIRVNIMDLLRRVLVVTEHQRQDQGIRLQLEVPDDLPEIPVAPDQIEQVFLNLVLNAIEAMPDGGTLGVIVERTIGPAGINISCIDTGGGIPDEVLPHIFDFLYTTKEQGTGMGLFVCRSIVRQHNGRLEVFTEPPHGTRFDLWLPEDGE